MTEMTGLVVFRNPAADAAGYCSADREPAGQTCPVDYLRARERAERAAAKRAQTAAARHVHQELAQQYAELAQAAN